MADLQHMTTEAAEAWRQGFAAAKEQAANKHLVSAMLYDRCGAKIDAAGHREWARQIRAMEPGE